MIQFINESLKLIGMNSISSQGNEEIAVHCQTLMNSTGMKSTLQPVTHSLEGVSKRQFNVIGILGDPLVDSRTRKGLMLTTHLDTAPSGVTSQWTEAAGNPMQAMIKGDKIYGLGAANAKLDFLCKLKACEQFRDRKLKMPVYLVGTAASELGLLGTRFLIKSMYLNPKYVFIGEPTDLNPLNRCKANSVYQISIQYNQLERDAKGFNTRIEVQSYGKSSHCVDPTLGDNSIMRMLDFISQVRQANFQLRLSKMSGGDGSDKVPDLAHAEFFIPSGSLEDFRRFYQSHENEASFSQNLHVEFGGLGESGVKFLPDNILDAVGAVQKFVLGISETMAKQVDQGFSPAYSTINFFRLNQRAGALDLFYDARLLPGVSPEEFDRQMKEGISSLGSAFPSFMMRVLRTRHNPGFMGEDSECSRAAKEASADFQTASQTTKQALSNELSPFLSAGYDAIAFGPGQALGNSHSPNEHVGVDQLDSAVHFYSRLIERFCL